MSHGERSARQANHQGRDYWGRRPLSGSPSGPTRRGVSIKTLTHRIERRRAKNETKREAGR